MRCKVCGGVIKTTSRLQKSVRKKFKICDNCAENMTNLTDEILNELKIEELNRRSV